MLSIRNELLAPPCPRLRPCVPAVSAVRPSVRRVMRTAFCIIDIDTAAAAAAAAAAKERQASVIGTALATA